MRLDDAAARETARLLGRSWEADAAVVLGSGLDGVAERFDEEARLAYAELPLMGTCGVPGHRGILSRTTLDGLRVLLFRGRRHLYEGIPPSDAAATVRLAAALGARLAVLFAAAGGVASDLEPGDWVFVTDHLNWMGRNPLEGVRTEAGPPFLDLSRLYRTDLYESVREEARHRGIGVRGGIYAAFPGPTYETPAEIRWARLAGATVVGMSVVPEAVWARFLGMDVVAWARVANPAAGLGHGPVTHDEVLAACRKAGPQGAVLLELTMKAWCSTRQGT